MNVRNRRMCRFCMKILYDDEYKLIGEITKQMFDMLLLKPNMNINMENVICKECTIKLQTSVSFKSACLNTEKKILPFIKSEEDAKLVLKEEIELRNIAEDQKICRFCKNLTENGCYTYLQRQNMFLVDMVQKYIPELNLKVTEELITCQMCLEALQSFLNFIMDLLDVEEKIKDDMNMNRTEVQEKLDNVSNLTIKHEIDEGIEEKVINSDFVTVNNEENQELDIKHEEIEIKSEDSCGDSFQDTSQATLYEECNSDNPSSYIIVHKCKTCPYESKDKSDLRRHSQTHDYNSEITYRGKPKSSANPRTSPHREPPAFTNTFCCEICTHVTNRKGNLKLHMLTHRAPPDLRMYTCEECTYATDQKRSLKQHMITHKSPSETRMYGCGRCRFESKHQGSLDRHILTHLNPSEITTFKCESCPFQSKHESSLIRHVLTHQNPSEIRMYKCGTCSYEAPQKDRLRRHMLVHRPASETVMYNCQKCSFQTKRSDKLKRHELTHHDLSEVAVYKCGRCSYRAKRKDNLKQHMVVHRTRSESKIYRCKSCPYEAKYKRCFEKHIQTH